MQENESLDHGASDDFDSAKRDILFQSLLKLFRQDMAHVAEWRKNAREDYAFYNGEQWEAQDKVALFEQKRPVRVEGDSVYVLYLHPTQVTALRTNTATGQWLDIQKAAYQGSRAKNPIFDGSLGMYNGVVLREAEHITEGVNSADPTTPVSNTRRAVLLGAQASIVAFGKDRGPTRYKLVEEFFDYERELGVAAKTLIGMKKTNFKLKDSTIGEQDFATIVISTYAEPL